MRLLLALLLLAGTAKAQFLSVVNSKPTPAGTCQNWTILDWSGGTNGVQPTPTTLTNSTYNLPAGGSLAISDPNIILTYSTAAVRTPFLTTPPCITGTSWPNTSTLGLAQANGLNQDYVVLNYTSPSNAVVACVPFYTTIPQASTFGRMDTFIVGDPFTTFQISGDGTHVNHLVELGGTPILYPGDEFFGPVWPTGTWQNVCSMITSTSGGTASTQSSGSWDASGNYIAGSGFTTPNSAAYTANLIRLGDLSGAGVGPAATSNYFGTVVACGISAASTACTFPLIPGYQLIPPTDSPGTGSYATTQSVTLTSPSAIASTPASIFYSTSGTATCSSTLYTGAISIASDTTLSAVTCLSGFATSPVLTSVYKIGAPTIPHPACFIIGANASFTSAAINTTGANAVVVGLSVYNSFATVVVDNLSGQTLTPLAGFSDAGGGTSQLYYELNPSTTGAGATFTFTNGSTMFASACVSPVVGILGVYDGNGTGANPGGSTCQTGSITPGGPSQHVAITSVSAAETGTIAIDSSYSIVGQNSYSAGANFGGASAWKITGTATNPTWSNLTAQPACSIASFH